MMPLLLQILGKTLFCDFNWVLKIRMLDFFFSFHKICSYNFLSNDMEFSFNFIYFRYKSIPKIDQAILLKCPFCDKLHVYIYSLVIHLLSELKCYRQFIKMSESKGKSDLSKYSFFKNLPHRSRISLYQLTQGDLRIPVNQTL